jgi:hypothetical protein
VKRLALFILLFFAQPALAQSMDIEPQCADVACGHKLKVQGWEELSRCWDGHQWAYVLKLGNEQRVCFGINARGGPTEEPCEAFHGDFNAFENSAQLAKAQNAEYDQASHNGRLDAYLDEFIKGKRKALNCWEAAGRDLRKP